MSRRMAAVLVAAGVVGISGLMVAAAMPGSAALAAAQAASSGATVILAQAVDPKKKGGAAVNKGNVRGAPRVAPRVVGPRVAPRVVRPRIVPRVVGPRVAPRVVGPRVAPRVVGPRVAPRVVGPRVAPRVVGPRVAPRVVGPRVGPRVVGPRVGPRIGARIGGPIVLGGRRVGLIRGRRHVFWRGHRRSLVPLAAIAGLTIGAIAYSAYAYVPVEARYCSGFTEDGCELRWTEVPTDEGDLVPQCVAYCPF